jgi:hypothetical protein
MKLVSDAVLQLPGRAHFQSSTCFLTLLLTLARFFQCKHLPEFSTLQDGGVRANNPFGIAQEECRIIWPSAQTFDLLISVGTGYVPSIAEEHILG